MSSKVIVPSSTYPNKDSSLLGCRVSDSDGGANVVKRLSFGVRSARPCRFGDLFAVFALVGLGFFSMMGIVVRASV